MNKMKNVSPEKIQQERDSIFDEMPDWADYVLIRETGLNTFGEATVLTDSMRAEIKRIETRKDDFNDLVGWNSDLYISEADFEENAREMQSERLVYLSISLKVKGTEI